MQQIPPIPSWDAMHPLIIHFPIVLLLLSPLFILISVILAPAKGRPYLITGLAVLLLGTASPYAAASTGEAASEAAERGSAVKSVLSIHKDLASETRGIFSALSVILVAIFLAPRIWHTRETRLASTYVPLAFLVFYSVGVLSLVNTAHAGGRLVHEFGVHAHVAPGAHIGSLPAEGSKSEINDTD